MKDLFDKKTGQLYYKTNNVTSIPNKYKDFLNFIGSTNDLKDNNCKYDGVNCLKYNDLRIR
jgi:ABC-type transport system involved in cytochrome c biogenesis ATPase subunit